LHYGILGPLQVTDDGGRITRSIRDTTVEFGAVEVRLHGDRG